MKALALLLVLVLALTGLAGCNRGNATTENFFFMDTLIGVTLYTQDTAVADAAFAQCRTILSELERLWSRHISGSEIDLFHDALQQGKEQILDDRTCDLLSIALDVSAKTNGAFDITVAPLVDLWQICGEEDRLPSDLALSDALMAVGYQKLTLQDGRLSCSESDVRIDLGGIGKGAAIGLLLEHLEKSSADGGVISFGSNVAVFGEKPSGDPFRIAIRDPKDGSATVGTLLLKPGQILSVSGDYERYVTIGGEQYHHIIDPKTGYPADTGLSSVAVITSDGALADALSTALFVMGEDAAMELYRNESFDFEAIFIGSDGALHSTEGLSDCFIRGAQS